MVEGQPKEDLKNQASDQIVSYLTHLPGGNKNLAITVAHYLKNPCSWEDDNGKIMKLAGEIPLVGRGFEGSLKISFYPPYHDLVTLEITSSGCPRPVFHASLKISLIEPGGGGEPCIVHFRSARGSKFSIEPTGFSVFVAF